MTEKFYVTTAIDYVNASPHIGHAFEKVIADALARWHRLKGDNTFFLTGTDENAQKNSEAAKEAGIPPQEFVDKNSKIFIKLCKELQISNDHFIRTTSSSHKKIAREIFQKVYDAGEIYKGKYSGKYCKGCEAFVTEKDLVNGKCPEHNREPEEISEDAYFFKLSKYKDQLIKFIENYIVPKSRKKEILSRLKEEGLRDLCVSRTNLDWGIDSPIDPKYKIYVWFDALINYYSGAKDNWPATLHIVGKGINWFHSVIWPAMLMSAGIELPKKLLVHGYLTFNGQKISKSLGNAIDPLELINKYSIDSVRYNLFRGSTFDDFDFSESELVERNNAELANKYGNLVSRVTSLAEKYGIEESSEKISASLEKIHFFFDNFELDKALNEIFSFIDSLNEFIQEKKPWETKDSKVLYTALQGIRDATILLSPFIPVSTKKVSKNLGFELSLDELDKPLKNLKIKKIPSLFQKLEFSKPNVSSTKPNLNKGEEPSEIMEGVTSIQYSDFEKLDIRVAKITNAEEIPGADKLFKLTVNLGDEERTLCAGIKPYYKIEDLKNKKIIVLANLEPRKLRGIESQGMLLAASNPDKSKVSLLTPDQEMEPGSKIN